MRSWHLILIINALVCAALLSSQLSHISHKEGSLQQDWKSAQRCPKIKIMQIVTRLTWLTRATTGLTRLTKVARLTGVRIREGWWENCQTWEIANIQFRRVSHGHQCKRCKITHLKTSQVTAINKSKSDSVLCNVEGSIALAFKFRAGVQTGWKKLEMHRGQIVLACTPFPSSK